MRLVQRSAGAGLLGDARFRRLLRAALATGEPDLLDWVWDRVEEAELNAILAPKLFYSPASAA